MTFVQQILGKTENEIYNYLASKFCNSKNRKPQMTKEEIIDCIMEKQNCNKLGKFCIDDNCQICWEKSFSSNDRALFANFNPRFTSKRSNLKKEFKCQECNHTFVMCVDNVFRGNWCSYCSNPPKQLCGNCDICFKKSFASNPRSKYLVDKTIDPRTIFKCSSSAYDFQCQECMHIFKMAISYINSDVWCPYCTNKILCEKEECKICFDKSFASNPKSKYLVDKTINPRMIFKYSRIKLKFICQDCNHVFKVSLDHTKNRWCSYCGNKKICMKKDCMICFNKSLASSPYCQFLVDKTLDPRAIFISSNTKYEFECNKCTNIFKMKLCYVAMDTWCQTCKETTENKLYDFILSSISEKCQKEKKFEWCKNKYLLRFDFYIERLKLIIELDGAQHFRQISNWKPPKHSLDRDVYKMKCLLKHGISVIRILQEDVWHNKNNWQERLQNAINVLNGSDVPIIIYLEKQEEYKDHQREMFSTNILQLKM